MSSSEQQPQQQGLQLYGNNVLEEARMLSDIVTSTQLCPAAYRGKKNDAIIAVLWGAEIGLRPMQALSGVVVINGRPSLTTEAAMAVCLGSGLLIDIQERVENGVAYCTIKRKGVESAQTRKFSVDDAKKANLWGKAGPWSQYPERMLQVRARAWCLRDTFADKLKGVCMAEEMEDVVVVTPPQQQEATGKSASKKIDAMFADAINAEVINSAGDDNNAKQQSLVSLLDVLLEAADDADSYDALKEVYKKGKLQLQSSSDVDVLAEKCKNIAQQRQYI